MADGNEPTRRLARRISSLLMVVCLAFGVGLAAPAHSASSNDRARTKLIAKLNDLRRAQGLKPLVVQAKLMSVAQKWSEHQLKVHTMSHNPKTGSQIPAGWRTWGENVGWAMGYPSNAATIHRGWVNSPGHYANMTATDFTHVGIGVATSPSGGMYATQVFAAYPASRFPAVRRPVISSLTPKRVTRTGWLQVVIRGKRLAGATQVKVGKVRTEIRRIKAKKIVIRIKVTTKTKRKLQVKVKTAGGWTKASKRAQIIVRK